MPFPTLTTVGTNRTIDVAQLDRPAVFMCFTQSTQDEAEPVELAIRARYSAAEVLVGYVVDLHSIPAMFRGIPEGVMASEYRKAVEALPPGETAEDYVVLMPDWTGQFVKSLSFPEDVSKRLGVAVFLQDGTLLGTAQGEGASDACLALLSGTSG
jgi:hypothetical protein